MALRSEIPTSKVKDDIRMCTLELGAGVEKGMVSSRRGGVRAAAAYA